MRAAMNVKRIAVALLVVFFGIGHDAAAGGAADNVALQWNSALLQAIRNTAYPPMRAARAFAIVHTCMYDAWAAYTPNAMGTRLGGALRVPRSRHTRANKSHAVSIAAYRALIDLFPTQQAALFDLLIGRLGYDQRDLTDDTRTPAGVGNVACAAVLVHRHSDGANQLGDLNGGAPYSDYTGYLPVNSPDALADPNRWQPLRTATGAAQVFAAPHWGLVAPFALESPDRFRPGPPAPAGSYEYWRQARDLVELSAGLTDRRKAIATYWADGPNTETPPGHWNLLAQWVSRRDRHTLDQDVKLFFVLGNAMLDASIAVWDAKRFYDYVRPISAIRFLFKGRSIVAWAGPGLGTQQIRGEAFMPYIPTPPFAEYTSGHSAFSAAAARVLQRFTGSPFFGASYTVAAGSSFVEPGVAPARDVTLFWLTFDDAADQAGRSRRYGGIHFEEGDLSSRRIGRAVADRVWRKARAYFSGTQEIRDQELCNKLLTSRSTPLGSRGRPCIIRGQWPRHLTISSPPWSRGPRRVMPGARNALFTALYTELHRLAQIHLHNRGRQLTLGATTLLHEAYLGISQRALQSLSATPLLRARRGPS